MTITRTVVVFLIIFLPAFNCYSQDVKINWLEIDQGKRNEIEKVIRLSDTSILVIDNNASKPVGLKPIYISSTGIGEVNAVMSTSGKHMEVYRRFFSKDQFFENDGNNISTHYKLPSALINAFVDLNSFSCSAIN